MTLCFPDEIDDHGTFVKISDIVDGAGPHERDPDSPTPEITKDAIAVVDLIDGPVGLIEGVPHRQRVSPVVGDIEIVDFGTAYQPRELRIGSDLSIGERDSLIQLLRSYLDVFAWCYEDMPGLDPSIVKEEIQKQLSVGFLSVVEYPGVAGQCRPCSKKDCKVRVCVDFRDLNKASLKDDFSLPYIDMLVDSTAGHSMFVLYGRIFRVQSDLDGSKGHGEDVLHYRRLPGQTSVHQQIHCQIEDICEPIFRLLRRVNLLFGMINVSVHLRGSESTCCRPPVWTSYTRPSFTPILSVSDVALGCMLAQLDDSGKDRKSIRGTIVADHLASLPVSDGRAIDDDFPNEDVATVTSLRVGACTLMDRHPATNTLLSMSLYLGLETALELGIRQMEVFGDSNLVLRQFRANGRLEIAQNQFADALATLASMIAIPTDATVLPLLIESRSVPTYCCLIDDMETDDGLPWYHDIYHFLRLGIYPEAATAKDKRALRQLATRFVICGNTLYSDHLTGCYYCVWTAPLRSSDERGSCGSLRTTYGGHMLARKIMRTGYFWLTMETDCCQFVQRCPECQIHGDLIHVPPSELQSITSPSGWRSPRMRD
ncbi:hypothetical protein CK203_029221 [Vitis vinifera]|uniref:RNase H type-1 domain-containing protein n=1 Tax=Vitis vinifera TaxID=29760 RepID=A0A438ISZ7_VITVI|nr:hypothetical protein CK203_029221 [Vitis vinifera]